eukprot:UN27714
MKGSVYKRVVGSNPINGDVLKDLDFRSPLYLSPKTKQLLLCQLKSDCCFLAENGFMDYSLLVGIKYTLEEDQHFMEKNHETTPNLLKKTNPRKIRRLSGYAF